MGNISLGLRQSLLANPVGWHLVLEGIAHFEVIAEDIVISHFQTGDTRLLDLSLLYLEQIILAVATDGTKVIQLSIIAIGDDFALVDQLWWVWLNLLGDTVSQRLTEVELVAHSLEGFVLGMFAGNLDRLDSLQGILQLHYLTRRYSAHCHLGDDTLQVADAMELVIEELTELRLLEEILHDVESLIDGFNILQRENKPSTEHTTTHCRHRSVDDIEKRRTILLHRSHQLQAADGKAVHAHKFILLDARESRDMLDLGMLSNLQVLHDGTASDDTILQVLHTETFQ